MVTFAADVVQRVIDALPTPHRHPERVTALPAILREWAVVYIPRHLSQPSQARLRATRERIRDARTTIEALTPDDRAMVAFALLRAIDGTNALPIAGSPEAHRLDELATVMDALPSALEAAFEAQRLKPGRPAHVAEYLVAQDILGIVTWATCCTPRKTWSADTGDLTGLHARVADILWGSIFSEGSSMQRALRTAINFWYAPRPRRERHGFGTLANIQMRLKDETRLI